MSAEFSCPKVTFSQFLRARLAQQTRSSSRTVGSDGSAGRAKDVRKVLEDNARLTDEIIELKARLMRMEEQMRTQQMQAQQVHAQQQVQEQVQEQEQVVQAQQEQAQQVQEQQVQAQQVQGQHAQVQQVQEQHAQAQQVQEQAQQAQEQLPPLPSPPQQDPPAALPSPVPCDTNSGGGFSNSDPAADPSEPPHKRART